MLTLVHAMFLIVDQVYPIIFKLLHTLNPILAHELNPAVACLSWPLLSSSIVSLVSRDANQALFKLSALLINAQCCASHGTVLSLCKGCNECHVNSAQSPLQNKCWKRVLIRHTLVAGAPSTSVADLETAAINVYKRLKSTRTPLQTTRQAGKALLDASQLCGAELVHTLLGDMPDAQALEAAAQSMKQQLEECPC